LQDELWRHSLATAVAARLIAEKHNVSLREEAFITGLMHDIAKPVLLQRFPDEYKPVIKAIRDDGRDEIEAERAMLGFTHAELCVHILEHWNIPAELTRAAGRHHDYDGTTLDNPDIAIEPREVALSHIVCLANELAKKHGYEFAGSNSREPETMLATESLGFDVDTLTELGDQMDEAYKQTEEHFQSA
jgi:putative nucleotidyltransferase with HDIG domain